MWCYCRVMKAITRLPFRHLAVRSKGCQCLRRAVVLHSPRGLRESLPEQSHGPDRLPPPYLWWRRRHPGIRAWNSVVEVSGCSGVPTYLECGPVALWWCYRGKRGDLQVAFFLCGLANRLCFRWRKNVRQILSQLMGLHRPSSCPRDSKDTLCRNSSCFYPLPHMRLLYAAAPSKLRLVVPASLKRPQ